MSGGRRGLQLVHMDFLSLHPLFEHGSANVCCYCNYKKQEVKRNAGLTVKCWKVTEFFKVPKEILSMSPELAVEFATSGFCPSNGGAKPYFSLGSHYFNCFSTGLCSFQRTSHFRRQ